GLQIVLNPVVDLPDHRILRHELAFRAPDLRHITAHEDSPCPHTVLFELDGAQGKNNSPRFDFGCPGTSAEDDDGKHLINIRAVLHDVGDLLGQYLPGEPAPHTEPVEC